MAETSTHQRQYPLLVLCLLLTLASTALGQPKAPLVPNGSSPSLMTLVQQARIEAQNEIDTTAKNAYLAGNYDLAIRDAQMAIASFDPDVIAPFVLAKSLEAEGKTAEALKAYRALVGEGNSYPTQMIPYAHLLVQEGDWNGALTAYEKALPYLPESDLLKSTTDFSVITPTHATVEAAIDMAQALVDVGGDFVTPHAQYDKALAEAQKALALEPNWAVGDYYEGVKSHKVMNGRRAAWSAPW
jgi:tetratricopeptide (TPR) repeat protein